MNKENNKIMLLTILMMLFIQYLVAFSLEDEKKISIMKIERIVGVGTTRCFRDINHWVADMYDANYNVNNRTRAKVVSDSLLDILEHVTDYNSAMIDSVTYEETSANGPLWERYVEIRYEQRKFKGIDFDGSWPGVSFKYKLSGPCFIYFSFVTEIEIPEPPYISYVFMDSLAQDRIREFNETLKQEMQEKATKIDTTSSNWKYIGKRIPNTKLTGFEKFSIMDYTIKLLLCDMDENKPNAYRVIYRIRFQDSITFDIDAKTGKILRRYHTYKTNRID